ncbi:oxidoreductase [Hamadaea tsunoensis]|uniref:oxidoreductase n=1 Tax=Hamadaea tsunoensis TaxID=53368 RepID=UPI00068506D1|nr:oxidoreductase [Hamadaea tsunoensis]
MSTRWSADDVPDQGGRTVVITGANTGIGFETAAVLAARGATVILACRDAGRAETAAGRLRSAVPGARIETLRLDLASLAAVRDAAEQFRAGHSRLDLLINNAGVIHPGYARTEDGFELHFGTNHLGHFAFTGLLLDRLLATPGSRVVTVSSSGHRRGDIHLADLTLQQGYGLNAGYGQSKLANVMFTYALQRKLAAAGAATLAVAAHPGNAYTEVGRHMPGWVRVALSPRLRLVNWWLLQSAGGGALPTLRAATDPQATGGTYYGPSGPGEFTGSPALVASSPRSYDVDLQRRLWAESERLTGVRYELAAAHGEPAAADR